MVPCERASRLFELPQPSQITDLKWVSWTLSAPQPDEGTKPFCWALASTVILLVPCSS